MVMVGTVNELAAKYNYVFLYTKGEHFLVLKDRMQGSNMGFTLWPNSVIWSTNIYDLSAGIMFV